MGSGGRSSWFGSRSPEDLIKQIRSSEDKVKDDQFETEVAGLVAARLAEYNDRNVDGINALLDRISKELGKDFEMALQLRFGGSVSKGTFINGLSDIDALVLLHKKDVENQSPEQVRKIFAERLKARFGNGKVYEGAMAVTVTIDGQEIQLLPAVKQGSGYKIASNDGKTWSSIRPRHFSKILTERNEQMSGKLVPMIKLAKAIIATLPEQRRLRGHHIEVLAADVFKNYEGPKIAKNMLRHFFEQLPHAVRSPMTDVTGQSIYVDSYLGARDSIQRSIAADALDRIARRIKNADGSKSTDQWRGLLEGDVT